MPKPGVVSSAPNNAVAAEDGVERHDQERNDDAEPAGPLELLGDRSVRIHRTETGLAAECELAEHDNEADENRKQQVDQQEREAAALTHLVREAPDVAEADRRTDGGKQEANVRAEGPTIVPLFGNRHRIFRHSEFLHFHFSKTQTGSLPVRQMTTAIVCRELDQRETFLDGTILHDFHENRNRIVHILFIFDEGGNFTPKIRTKFIQVDGVRNLTQLTRCVECQIYAFCCKSVKC